MMHMLSCTGLGSGHTWTCPRIHCQKCWASTRGTAHPHQHVAGQHAPGEACVPPQWRSQWCVRPDVSSWEVLFKQVPDEGGLPVLHWPTRSSMGLSWKSASFNVSNKDSQKGQVLPSGSEVSESAPQSRGRTSAPSCGGCPCWSNWTSCQRCWL